MEVSEWVQDLSLRLQQLRKIVNNGNLRQSGVWLGGLFYPEAYITATRQTTAHQKKWSLETLELCLDIEKVDDPSGFVVEGMSSV